MRVRLSAIILGYESQPTVLEEGYNYLHSLFSEVIFVRENERDQVCCFEAFIGFCCLYGLSGALWRD